MSLYKQTKYISDWEKTIKMRLQKIKTLKVG